MRWLKERLHDLKGKVFPFGTIGREGKFSLLRMISRAEDILVLLFSLGMFLVGAYGLYDSYMVYTQANDDSILQYKPGYEEETPEKEIQGNMVAWLTLDGTKIDYPVMQGDTNYEYLNTNPYGEFALSGSVFLDFRNSPDFSDTYSLLYGHHMANGYMFGDLDQYRETAFFQKYRTGTLTVGEEKRSITIMAVLDVQATDAVIFSPDNCTEEKLLDKIRENAIQYRQAEGEQYIAFSTCRYPDTAERTVVVGVLE